MSSKEAAKNAVKKRSTSGTVKTAGASAEDMKFFSSESSGMQLHPKTVLLISIVYMGIVVALHIFGKLR